MYMGKDVGKYAQTRGLCSNAASEGDSCLFSIFLSGCKQPKSIHLFIFRVQSYELSLIWQREIAKKVPYRRLCLTASKRSMAALTDTLSESRRPFMGMRMCASAALRQASVSPVASVPMTMAVACVMSVS